MPKASQKTKQKGSGAEGESSQASQSGRRRKKCDDDEEDATQSTQSQAKHVLSKEELNRKVSDLVRYMLFMDGKKTAVRRGDITKNVMKEHSRSFPTVFAEAQKKMKKTFGYELVEAEHNKQKIYLLVNTMPDEQRNYVESNPDDLPKMGLLFIILATIFMKDNVLSEEVLWQTLLKKLGIIKGKNHRTFGDVEKLISVEFVRQMYLERKKVVAGEIGTFTYRWGVRAEQEVSKRQVLQMVAELYGTDIEAWTTKYKEVTEEEDDDSADEVL